MTFEELLNKYQALLLENNSLREEIRYLNSKFGVLEVSNQLSENGTLQFNINNMSEPKDKIELFMSLFKGRDDVYAKRWENNKKGTNGYSPFCLNEWKPELCKKPKEKCSACSHKAYAPLNEKAFDDHLRGRNNLVVN